MVENCHAITNPPRIPGTSTSMNETNIISFVPFIRKNQRIRRIILADIISTSVGSVETITHQKLQFNKISAQWVLNNCLLNRKPGQFKSSPLYYNVLKKRLTNILRAQSLDRKPSPEIRTIKFFFLKFCHMMIRPGKKYVRKQSMLNLIESFQ